MTDFEKYVLQNRDELDRIEQPRTDMLWSKLRHDLGHEPKLRTWNRVQVLAVAAVIIVLIGMGIVIGLHLQEKDTPTYNFAISSPDLARQEAQYQQLVREKMDEIQYDTINQRNFQSIFEELQTLEELHQQVINDLPRYGENDQLERTVIKYYELKIRILERLEKELNKQQHHERRIQQKAI